ncbi:LysR family transcriptional regulator [Comamonas sp. B-9]|uniref:LysR family transcriptional regulator n=1 Tax=Comamonas sp. B-9 TaxID=1055192 RepID=UPI0003957E60|nr:LysR family transcriptional regulator [Comamonas sp. B-9]
MDRFQEMQVFVRVADRSSFAQASDDLQIPRATVTNLVQRLEARVGARLLDRTTRQVRLTAEGEDYYRRCTRLLADLQEAESAFRHAPPQGLLRVNLQGTLARFFVMPHLGAFAEQYPEVQLHMAEDDRLVDLVREGVDCVLRAGSLQSSSLIGRQVASLRQVTVVSRAYAERHGLPQSLDDLAQHAAVAYVSSATGRPVALEFCVGKQVVERRLKPSITVNGADLYTGAAMAGLGMVQVPRYRIAQALEDGDLLEVLPDLPPPPMPVSVLHPYSRQPSARLRVFIDWLAERFVDVT